MAFRVTLLMAAVSLVAACGSTTQNQDGGTGGGTASTGGGTGSTGGGSGSTGGGTGSTGGGSGSTGGGSGSTKTASFTLAQSTNVGVTSSVAGAVFFDGPAANSCTSTVDGQCTVSDCALGTPDAGTADAGTFQSAGTLTISGTSVDGGVITLGPSVAGYSAFVLESAWTAANQQLTFAATGAAVPAFSKAVPSPSAVTFTAPTCSLTGCGTINRSSALTVTWTGGAAGTNATISMSTTSSTKSVSAVCTVPSTAGTFSVPTTVLSKLPAGNGYFTASGVTTDSVTAGSWTVQLLASGGGAAGAVTFQ